MANVQDIKKSLQKGELSFPLGGRKRTLQFDLNAFAELEVRFGSVNEAMKALKNGGMKGIRSILWAALIHDEAILDENTGEPISYKITPFEVGSWIKPQMLPELSEKLTEAMGVNLPAMKDSPEIQKALSDAGITLGEDGLPVATVIYSEEEKQQMELEAKNV